MAQIGSMKITPGNAEMQYRKALRKCIKNDVVRRIMNRDAGVFVKQSSQKQRDLEASIANRLGWVDIAGKMKRQVKNIEKVGEQALADGIKHVVLCGMGGSSLGPEVFGVMFGGHKKVESYHVVDSTAPAAIKAVLKKIELKETLFIVSSKSGTTVETRSQQAFFENELSEAGVRNIGKHFVAVTDRGSELERYGRSRKYRKVFTNPSDIGGRYSTLSYFGLVPGFFAGVDLGRLLDDAVEMEKILSERDDETNPAAQLGALMVGATQAKSDKMTFLAARGVAPFIAWIEQLVAESTGKKKKGVVPIEGEEPAGPKDYGPDRFFVEVQLKGGKGVVSDKQRSDLVNRKYPYVQITLADKHQLGRQMLLWEAATAVAGYLLSINPFDEPNVTESKFNTKAILSGIEKTGVMPSNTSVVSWGKLSLLALGDDMKLTPTQKKSLSAMLKRLFGKIAAPQYVAILCYMKSDKRREKILTEIRTTIRKRKRVAVLRGYGPRYLHSIGQLYKGGPANGVFIVLLRDDYESLDVPERPFDFGQLITAQAIGDAQALVKRDLPTLVLSIKGNPADGLEVLAKEMTKALK